MAAVPALVALVAPAMDDPMLLSVTTWATKAIWPARLLKCGLTLLLCAVELYELRQRKTRLELDPIHGHSDPDGYMCISLRAGRALTELAT
jgi:hypothetical protein